MRTLLQAGPDGHVCPAELLERSKVPVTPEERFPIRCVFISEIFRNRVRARGPALGSFTHWIMAEAIPWIFPRIAAKSGVHAFAFYMLCCVGQLIRVLKVMPETKGVSLEQIQKRLGTE